MIYQEQIARSRERFERDTAEHGLTVLRDDDLYRHLRCQKPGTYCYGFDLVTWPGYLAYVGDMGDYVFSRLPDMFRFFESDSGRINPDYWSEKLQAPRYDAATVYSATALKAWVRQWYDDRAEELSTLERAELDSALFDQILSREEIEHDERSAHQLLIDFEHDGHRMDDAWEASFREYDGRFLWCCHAIVWGIGQYREATSSVPA